MKKTEISIAERAGNAIERLRKSERGEYCLRHFLQLINESAHSLDSHGWEALQDLAEYCKQGGVGSLLGATRGMQNEEGRYHG